MGHSISILPLIEALERAEDTVRLICNGEDTQYELWIESGVLIHWESSQQIPLEELLLRDVFSIWMRPIQAEQSASSDAPVKLYELLQKTHELKADRNDHEARLELNITTKPKAPTSPKSAALNPIPETVNSVDPLQINDNAVTVPNPANTPPAPAKPIRSKETKTADAEQFIRNNDAETKIVSTSESIANKRHESKILNMSDESLITFTKGSKERRIIGRSDKCDLVVKKNGISRQHCELFFDGNLIHVKDLNSANGTYLDNKLIHMAVAGSGDILGIGEIVFKFKINETAVEAQ